MSVDEKYKIRKERNLSDRVYPFRDLDHHREIAQLQYLDRKLDPAFRIYANAKWKDLNLNYIGRPEIDVVIQYKHHIWIVDLKSYSSAVEIFNDHSDWSVTTWSGQIKKHRNYLDVVDEHAKKFASNLKENYKEFKHKKVYGFVVFEDMRNVTLKDHSLRSFIFSQDEFVEKINSLVKPEKPSDIVKRNEFKTFVDKHAGESQPIRIKCPVHADKKMVVENDFITSSNVETGWLENIGGDKAREYYFVRIDENHLNKGHDDALEGIIERLKKSNLNRLPFESPEIVHDIDNFCVWFIYPLVAIDAENNFAYRKRLLPFLDVNTFDLQERLELCIKFLECVQLLHNFKVCHRLLSDNAVWVEPSGRDFVLFGFEHIKMESMPFSDVTVTGLTAHLRDPLWEPPEYKKRYEYSKANHYKSDVYSVGLILALILSENPKCLLDKVSLMPDDKRWKAFVEDLTPSISEEIPGVVTQIQEALDSVPNSRPSIDDLLSFFKSSLKKDESSHYLTFSEVENGTIIDGRFEIIADLVPGVDSGFKIYAANDFKHEKRIERVVLKFACDEQKKSDLDKEKLNIEAIRTLSMSQGELAGIELPDLLSSIDVSPDLGASFFVRKYFDVDSSENVSSNPIQIFSNLKKIISFIKLVHDNGYAIRDICHTNFRWQSNGGLVVLDLGSVCLLDDSDATFNGKVDFLPPLRGEDLETREQRILRDYFASLVTCYRWTFGFHPWDFQRVFDVSSIQFKSIPEDVSSRFKEEEYVLIKRFFEKTLGREAFKNGQYDHFSLLDDLDELLGSLGSLEVKVDVGPIVSFQGYTFDEPVVPEKLDIAIGQSANDIRSGYLLSCSNEFSHEGFDSIVSACLDIDRDHNAFDLSEDSGDEHRLALLKLNSLPFTESNLLKPCDDSDVPFSGVALSAVSLLDKVNGEGLSIYWSGDRFWGLPNKLLELIGLSGSDSSLYIQVHNHLSCFPEYSLNVDDYSDAVSYREALVEFRDALLNPRSFPTERFAQLSLVDGHFIPNEFEVVFGTDDARGKEVILLACSREFNDESYSSILTLLNEVQYRYRLFSFDDRSDDDYFMCLLESNISIPSFPEGLQKVIESDDMPTLNLQDCISFLKDIGELAYYESYLLLYCEDDFRIVPNALVSEIGIQAHVSTLGDQCLDMLRKLDFLPKDIAEWDGDTLSQLSDHLGFLNALEDKGDEWRDILDELPWREVQGYLTKCLVDGEGPFRTHNMYARPEEAKLGEGRSGIVYETLPDGLVLKIAKSPKGVGDEPGGINEEEWNREVALHEKVRGYSLPGLTQYMAEERGFMYFRCDPGETLKSRYDKGETFSDFVSLVASFNDYLSSLHELTNHDIFATDICPDNIIVVGDRSSRGPRCIHIDLGPGYHRFWSPPEEDFSGVVITKPLNGMMYSFTKVLAAEVLLMGSANRSVLEEWYQFAVTYYSESMNTHDLVYSSGHRADEVEVWRNLEGELTKSLVEVCNVSHSRLNELLPRILKFFKSGLKVDMDDRFVDLNQMNEMLQGFRSDLLEAK